MPNGIPCHHPSDRHHELHRFEGGHYIQIETPWNGPYQIMIDRELCSLISRHHWYPIVQTVNGRENGKVVSSFGRRTVSLSRFIWELAHGPLDPPGRRVFTRDGDWTDLRVENLRLSKAAPAAHLGRRFP